MRSLVFRVLGGFLGLSAALVAIFGPLLFISNELQEAESARQYDGHVSLPGALGGSLLVLAVAVFFAFVAYILLRFSFRAPKPN